MPERLSTLLPAGNPPPRSVWHPLLPVGELQQPEKEADRGTAMSSRYAYDLIVLLRDFVKVCDLKEDHTGKAIGKRFANIKEEEADYRNLQEKHILPLIAKCDWTGFKYADLMDIIPPPFATDYNQRRELLEDLITWSVKEFGEYDIPF